MYHFLSLVSVNRFTISIDNYLINEGYYLKKKSGPFSDIEMHPKYCLCVQSVNRQTDTQKNTHTDGKVKTEGLKINPPISAIFRLGSLAVQ